MGLLGLLLPSRCAACDVPGPSLCTECRAALVRIAAPGLRAVRVPRRMARASLRRVQRPQALVRAGKGSARVRRAGATARLRLEGARAARPCHRAGLPRRRGDRPPEPSPGSRTSRAIVERGRERGHVPAARLAHALGLLWDLPVESLLERTAAAAPRQAGLPREERLGNVRTAFGASGIPPPDVALVDDVYTTGATASACARVLRRAGAHRVEVVCLARAVR